MKILFGVLTVTFLITTALVTLARRQNSGWIAFQSDRDGEYSIFLMTGDGRSVRNITPDVICDSPPQWSPDGQWIALVKIYDETNGRLNLIPSGGGQPQLLDYKVTSHPIVHWSPDSQQMLISRGTFDTIIVDADGSGERVLTNDYLTEQWSPDGEWIYGQTVAGSQDRLDRFHVETGRAEQLLRENITSDLSWSPDTTQIVFGSTDDDGLKLVYIAPDGGVLQTTALDIPGRPCSIAALVAGW